MFKASIPSSHRPKNAPPKAELYRQVSEYLVEMSEIIDRMKSIPIPEELPWSSIVDEGINIVRSHMFECAVIGPPENGARAVLYQGPRKTGEKIYRILKANWR